MNVEDTIFTAALPVNGRVMIKRLETLLDELKTNGLSSEVMRNDIRVRKLMWLINTSFYGQMATIDLSKLYNELIEEEKVAKSA